MGCSAARIMPLTATCFAATGDFDGDGWTDIVVVAGSRMSLLLLLLLLASLLLLQRPLPIMRSCTPPLSLYDSLSLHCRGVRSLLHAPFQLQVSHPFPHPFHMLFTHSSLFIAT